MNRAQFMDEAKSQTAKAENRTHHGKFLSAAH